MDVITRPNGSLAPESTAEQSFDIQLRTLIRCASNLPNCRERSLITTKLEEAGHWFMSMKEHDRSIRNGM